jgi:hypothetical protein
MVDEYDTPCIIGFDSCQPFGRALHTISTPGWINKDFVHSAQDHDDIALGKLRAWLGTQSRDSIRD